NRRRSEVDQHLAERCEERGVLLVRLGAGGVEDDADLVEARQTHQPLDAFVRGRDPHPSRPRQPVRGGVDAHHGAHLEVLGGPEDLDHQVGADVPGTDDGHLGLTHDASWEKWTVMGANPVISAVALAPGATARIGPRAPESTTWPARSGSPSARAFTASHWRARSGS